MTGFAAVLAGLAAWLFVPPSPNAALSARVLLPAVAKGIDRPARRLRLAAIPLLGGLVALFGGWVGLPAIAFAALASTSLHVWSRSNSHAKATRLAEEVATACLAIAGQLRAGRAPMAALQSASESCAALVPVVAVGGLGGDVGAALRSVAKQPGLGGLLALARVWEVTLATGAAPARFLEFVAEGLRSDRETARVVATELAAARATGHLLALLPLAGLALGHLLGGDPLGFLFSSSLGRLALAAAAVLVCLGILWNEALLRSVRPAHAAR